MPNSPVGIVEMMSEFDEILLNEIQTSESFQETGELDKTLVTSDPLQELFPSISGWAGDADVQPITQIVEDIENDEQLGPIYASLSAPNLENSQLSDALLDASEFLNINNILFNESDGDNKANKEYPNPFPLAIDQEVISGTSTDDMEVSGHHDESFYGPRRINRKRPSVSDSLSSSEGLATQKMGGKKKTKMYELPDKGDPLVARAGYAKSYRDKKKNESELVKKELADTRHELEKAKEVIKDLESSNSKQAGQIKDLNNVIAQRDRNIQALKFEMKREQDKNALNPQETESLYDRIQTVVKAACPPTVENVNIIVPERLANKKVAALGHEKILKIGADANLRNQSCSFTFELDEKVKNNTI